MKLAFSKDLHSKYALLKAAYHFTDEYYVVLNQDETLYYVDIVAKEGDTPSNIDGMFSNELVAQSTREAILGKTATLRELILARAFASTIMDENSDPGTSDSDASDGEMDQSLFKDWYEG